MPTRSAEDMNQDLQLDTFLEKLASQFEELEPGGLTPEQEFRQLAEWSSMQALVVIASFDWEYGVTITADELKAASTIRDLFDIVSAKTA